MSDRKKPLVNKGSFVGKTITHLDTTAVNRLVFTFSDGSKVELEVERVLHCDLYGIVQCAEVEEPKLLVGWEYCECGCHGHAVSVGALHLWLYNDLKGKFSLRRGHGWTMGSPVGEYKTMEEADRAAAALLDEEAQRVQGQLKKVRKEPRP